MQNNLIIAEGLSKSFGSIHAVSNASLHVAPGEIVSIMGRSGSGKTTLLHMLAGLESVSSGRVLFDGKEIGKSSEDELALWRRSHVGMIFQAFYLIPTLSAIENVALPLYPEHSSARYRKERALSCLSQVGLSGRATHRPQAMSGGEQQRVAIARALVGSPALVFADEPTGNLDSATGKEILELFHALRDSTNVAFLIITHDEKVAEASDRTIHIVDGVLKDE